MTDNSAALQRARRREGQTKRRRALAALQAMTEAGEAIRFPAVARRAGVSVSLLYADRDLLARIADARDRQRQAGAERAARLPTRSLVTEASLRTDLAVAQNEIRRLRAERDKLRGRLRLQLGAEIDGPDRADLIARVAALEAASRQFAAERDARAAEASHAQRRVLELEDELTAARESLRRAIRQANR